MQFFSFEVVDRLMHRQGMNCDTLNCARLNRTTACRKSCKFNEPASLTMLTVSVSATNLLPDSCYPLPDCSSEDKQTYIRF